MAAYTNYTKTMKQNRREFLHTAAVAAAGIPLLSSASIGKKIKTDSLFKLSLAEWSLHRALFAKKMTNLEFPVKAANEFGIYGVEYVSTFFKDTSPEYLTELLKITKDNKVTSVLIMVDNEGDLGNTDAVIRNTAVDKHHRWVDAARFLGCHSIRVNARGMGTNEEVANAAVDSLTKLSEYAAKQDINVIVENHGGISSNGKWLTGVMARVNMKNCGTLPDFGNFRISATENYDRYQGVQEMMPYAKGVSGKSYDFDADGNEVTMDFYRLMKIVKESGYRGWIDIEYEGTRLTEPEGIIATKRLLEKAIAAL
jgi:sugar phosphate isomerase/epimerase